MPRTHQKAPRVPGHYANWSEESLQNALADIRAGTMSYREAQDKYNIPKSTLQRKINDKQEYEKLVDELIVLAD